MRRKFLFLWVLFFLFFCWPLSEVFAQCPMCKASVESSMESGSTVGLGLNRGILYLLSMPYLLFTALFLLWYRARRKARLVVEPD